jgi:dihydroorotate dehydrogenase (fumarate)
MPDLSTTYLGLKLTSPLVPSASPLTADLDLIRRMEAAGAGAIVLPSLFEEQLVSEADGLDFVLARGTYSYTDTLTYLPEPETFKLAADQYLEHIRRAKQVVGAPIIASLNGVSRGTWTEYAPALEQAGADALELNIHYLPTDPLVDSAQIEQDYVDVLRDVWRSVNIPIAVKLSPFFTNFTNLATRLDQAGARGLVLFNRFNQPDIDLDTLEVVPRADLSTRSDASPLRLPLRWIGILYGRIEANLAGSGGVHSAEDALKLLLVGADVAMLASELILHGVQRLAEIHLDLEKWMDDHDYESVRQLRGKLSQQSIPFPAAFERMQYVRAISSLSHLAPPPTP